MGLGKERGKDVMRWIEKKAERCDEFLKGSPS